MDALIVGIICLLLAFLVPMPYIFYVILLIVGIVGVVLGVASLIRGSGYYFVRRR